ncbi:MAG: hypothetical protein P1U56_05440 [Saprospiraceae bacterium]|nr:hypothetical protein [Saprospiraceae bacterium]
MGFNLTYNRFFSVRVKEHGTNKEIRDLRFAPNAECQEFMNKYKLVFRHNRDGFDVYYRSNALASVPITSPIEEKTRFTFSVKILNLGFYDLYKPDVLKLPQFYLDNLTPSGNISNAAAGNLTSGTSFDVDDLGIIKPQSFRQQTDVSMGDPPTEWRIKKKFLPQDIIKTIPIENPDGLDYIEVRMNDPLLSPDDYLSESGVYSMETNKASFTETTLYLSNNLGGRSINGVLDIYWENSQATAPADTGKQYQIIFKLK